VDIGGFTDIITLAYRKKLQYDEKDLEDVETPIVRFRGRATYSLGNKKLLIRVGKKGGS